jgi:hypothetical protein
VQTASRRARLLVEGRSEIDCYPHCEKSLTIEIVNGKPVYNGCLLRE